MSSARVHEIQTAILGRMAEVGQARVAEAAGVSDATVSRWKDGALEQAARILAALGLKVVPQEAQVQDPAYMASLEHLASMALAAQKAKRTPGGAL
jgi:hypothetical protein